MVKLESMTILQRAIPHTELWRDLIEWLEPCGAARSLSSARTSRWSQSWGERSGSEVKMSEVWADLKSGVENLNWDHRGEMSEVWVIPASRIYIGPRIHTSHYTITRLGSNARLGNILWRCNLATVDAGRPEVYFLQDYLTWFAPILIVMMIIINLVIIVIIMIIIYQTHINPDEN